MQIALFSGYLHGQETVVEFDLRETGGTVWNGQSFIVGLLFGFICCAVWTLIVRLLERYRARIDWPSVRHWWPSIMLALGLMLLYPMTQNEPWGWAFDCLIWLFSILNFPALLAAAWMFELTRANDYQGVWLPLAASGLTMWFVLHLMVRLAEWRAWTNAPIALDLSDSPAASPDSRIDHE